MSQSGPSSLLGTDFAGALAMNCSATGATLSSPSPHEEQGLLTQEKADSPPTPGVVAEWAKPSTSPSTAARLNKEWL